MVAAQHPPPPLMFAPSTQNPLREVAVNANNRNLPSAAMSTGSSWPWQDATSVPSHGPNDPPASWPWCWTCRV